jgi:7-cyano-7-deazaguanine synthase
MPLLAQADRSDAASTIDPRATGEVSSRLIELLPVVASALQLASRNHAAAMYLGLCVGPEHADLPRAIEHLQIWAELVQLTCDRPGLEVLAPLLELEPWQVIDLGRQVHAPLEHTWSCEGDQPEPCGQCRGCRTREHAFVRSGFPDPRAPRRPGQA